VSGFTIRQLEIFAQVVEHGSFRRCAEHIGVSQVSISEHVRELESRLGVSLFDRHSGGPSTLTPEGRRAHRRVVAILADLNDLVLDVSGGLTGVTRRLTVCLPPFLMRYVGDALTEFRKLHPRVDVKLDLRLARVEELVERVRSRDVDLSYFFAMDDEGVSDSELVRMEPLAIFVGSGHPLARKSTVSVADVRATPAIRLAANNPLRMLVDRALDQSGVGGSPTYVETDEYGLILHAAHANHGFVCMFSSAAGDVTRSGELVRVTLAHPLPSLQVRRLMRHSAQHDAIANELSETLAASLAEPDLAQAPAR
jgi:DNA-binding transcriptional LysR family regulator